MTTENSFSKLTHTGPEIKLKNIHGKVDILKELFKCVSENNVGELARLLEGHELAEQSMNITLTKAFAVYSSTNKEIKDIIAIILKYKANPNLNIEQNVKHATSRKVANTFLTGLMFAAAQNDLYLANIFISHSCDLNLQDSNMRNALFYAINAQGDVYEMVSLLISSGINVNQSDREGHSPLTLAVSKGDREVTRILLNSGVNVDHQTNEGNSALHYAVSNNRPELIYLLLLRRPDLNLRNKNDQTPMDIASVLSRTEVYQILAEEYNNRESNPKICDLDSDVKEEDTTKPVNNPSSMSFKFLDKDAPVRTNTLEFISTKNPSYDLPTTYNQNLPSQNNINTQNYPTGFFNNNSINTQLINSSVNNNSFLPFNEITNTVSPINFAPNSNMGNPNITTNITTNANPNINTNINTNINNNSNLNSNLSQNFNSNPNNLNSLLNSSTIINPSQNVMNNNLNLSQYTQLNQSTRGGMPFTHKFTKTAKLQKLKLLQERNQMAGGKQIKDKVFKFPFNQNNNLTNIEIPFSFQSGGNGNLNANSQSNRFAKGNQLHTYIKIQSTPVLHIDISDEAKQDQLILNCQLDELRVNSIAQNKRLLQMETDLSGTLEENLSLKNELSRLKEESTNKDKYINKISSDWAQKESELLNRLDELQNKLKEESSNYQNLAKDYESLEKKFSEHAKECSLKIYEDKLSKLDVHLNKKEYLEKKFSGMKYDEKYIIKCLQKDILDFQDYTKEQIKKTKSIQEEIIKLIQEAVNDCMPDYEVRLYGSHATNLCLQWSDLDIVLIHKKNFNATNYNALQSLYLNLLEKPWKKSIKLIDSAVVPIIKMTSSESYNNMHIDISLQDNKHYGLKCVELVKAFMKEYEALEPLIFALKNILKNANLNDPYTGGLSSYGLILMVVSFLQSQHENKKSIKLTDNNLGRMFLEFLWYYGLMFDHSKYVIYAYPTNEVASDKDSINFLFNMQASHDLIIVDPLSKTNNVARSTYQFVNIKMAFMIGFVVSHEECECGCHYMKSHDEHSVYNSDHCILKRIFNSVKRFNANNQAS